MSVACTPFVIVFALWLDRGGLALSGGAVTGLACLALLVFGLPHGSLDIALLRQYCGLDRARTVLAVLVYLSLAAVMALAWMAVPVIALSLFLAVSCIHFSEDWADAMDPFFAVGTACAMLAAPSLFHRTMMGDIFAGLTGYAEASVIADVALLALPVASIATMLGMMSAARNGQPARAVETAITLTGMTLLPPVIGFAVYFCMAHSPRHYVATTAKLGANGHHIRREVVILSAAALGIAALVYVLPIGGMPGDRLIVASFVTLSILTVPHMTTPRILARLWRPSY